MKYSILIALLLTISSTSFAKGISCSTDSAIFEIPKIQIGGEIIFSDYHSALIQELVAGEPSHRTDLTLYFSVRDDRSPFKGNQKVVVTNVFAQPAVGTYPIMLFRNSDGSLTGKCKFIR